MPQLQRPSDRANASNQGEAMAVRMQWGRIVSVCDTCGRLGNVRRKDADACVCAAPRSEKIDYEAHERTALHSDRASDVHETHSAGVGTIRNSLPELTAKREFLARMGARGVAVSPFERVRFARAEKRVRGAA